jgi:hypothetical protein
MAKAASDFRTKSFDVKRVKAAGKDVGGKVHPKLYAIENLIRIIVHSVLSIQIGPQWWPLAADPALQKEVTRLQQSYTNKPWHSAPGHHEVYYIYLSDLTKILTTHSAHFAPHIPDIAQWTARLEQIRVPRNIVGHMNWLTLTDRRRIDVCHDDVEQLVAQFAAIKKVPLLIP